MLSKTPTLTNPSAIVELYSSSNTQRPKES
jgi:hypothetical protein